MIDADADAEQTAATIAAQHSSAAMRGKVAADVRDADRAERTSPKIGIPGARRARRRSYGASKRSRVARSDRRGVHNLWKPHFYQRS